MILTAHQPAYLPWLGLFHKIELADVYVFMDNVKYSKSDKFINRNYVKGPNGDAHLLTIPLLTGGSDNVSIFDLKIDNSKDWQRKHFMTIKQCYAKSTFWKDYAGALEELYNQEYIYLKDIAFDILICLLDILQIRTRVVKSSELSITSSKNQYLIDLCKKFDCSKYIFGSNGKDYADAVSFRAHGVEIFFQDYHHPEYRQLYGEFRPYLSVIDLLFNEGPASRDILLSGNIPEL